MKAVILARGLGTRMRRPAEGAELNERQREAAATGVKGMMPIGADRPFLDYVMNALADGGVDQICLVIGPEHSVVRDHYASLPTTRVAIGFTVQEEPRGTADAVLSAAEWVGDDRFLVLNSDNYYPVEAIKGLVQLPGAGIAAFRREALIALGGIPRERVGRYPVVRWDADFNLTALEDPAGVDDPDPAISMNLWCFTARIFEACRKIKRSPNGEFEIQVAVRYARDVLGEPFRVLDFSLPVLDITSRVDVAAVGRRLSEVEVRL